MKQPLIALLTDFGTSDPYVGIMKGIIAVISPETRFIPSIFLLEQYF